MRTVRHGPAVVGSQQHLAVRPRRPAPTAIAPVIPTTAARTSRRSVCSLPTTTIADLRSHALTIRLLRPHIQRRNLIPHRAAAIRLHLAPTPHPAAAIAVAVA